MPTYLEYLNDERNCFRFYRLDIQPTLFGGWSLVRQWGRIGTWGRLRISCFETREEAEGEAARLARSKCRRGYQEIVT
jgi:predicted DNA-binding WGR domain protein